MAAQVAALKQAPSHVTTPLSATDKTPVGTPSSPVASPRSLGSTPVASSPSQTLAELAQDNSNLRAELKQLWQQLEREGSSSQVTTGRADAGGGSEGEVALQRRNDVLQRQLERLRSQLTKARTPLKQRSPEVGSNVKEVERSLRQEVIKLRWVSW